MHPDAQQETRDRGARGLTRQRALSKKEIDRINRMFQDLQDMRKHDRASVVDHTQQKTSKMHPDAQQATRDRGARGLTRQRAISKKEIDRINRMFQDLQDMRKHDRASVVDHTQQKTSKMHPDAQQATQDRGARGLTRQRAVSKKEIDRINRMFQDLQDMRKHDRASVVDHTQQKTSKMHPDAQQATRDRGARGLTRQRAISKKEIDRINRMFQDLQDMRMHDRASVVDHTQQKTSKMHPDAQQATRDRGARGLTRQRAISKKEIDRINRMFQDLQDMRKHDRASVVDHTQQKTSKMHPDAQQATQDRGARGLTRQRAVSKKEIDRINRMFQDLQDMRKHDRASVVDHTQQKTSKMHPDAQQATQDRGARGLTRQRALSKKKEAFAQSHFMLGFIRTKTFALRLILRRPH